MIILTKLNQLKERVEKSILQFSSGNAVLIGDDGQRENEIDFVFHASFATPELVNLAISHAKGLLCVALEHPLANQLGLFTAPQFPGGISHTNFTLSIDAKDGITSGISAKDRAYTIRLMASPEASASNFITPGHVFPLRSVHGSLLRRAGHTEALIDLCKLSHLSPVGAMCEILDESGEPISPAFIPKEHFLSKLSYVSTVDLLWYKVLFKEPENIESLFSPHSNGTPSENECATNNTHLAPNCNPDNNKKLFTLNAKDEAAITIPCAIKLNSTHLDPAKLRIVLNQGFYSIDNGVKAENCSAEIILFSFDNLKEILPECTHLFCDLNEKVGLHNTKVSVKRLVTLLRALQFLCHKAGIKSTTNFIEKLNLTEPCDKNILMLLADSFNTTFSNSLYETRKAQCT